DTRSGIQRPPAPREVRGGPPAPRPSPPKRDSTDRATRNAAVSRPASPPESRGSYSHPTNIGTCLVGWHHGKRVRSLAGPAGDPTTKTPSLHSSPMAR